MEIPVLQSAHDDRASLERAVKPMERDWFSPARFALLSACLIVACFPGVILGRDTFFFRDFAIFSYPLASQHRECFWRGEIPLWNPYNDCGLPFLAQWNTMVLYPLSLIYLLLPLPWSLNFFCLFHLWLGGMGMYFLAKVWTRSAPAGALAGFAFLVSGVVLSCLKWPNNIAALAWMPWVVLAAEKAFTGNRRSLGIATLVGATQMLSGAPEIILLTWLTCGALWLYSAAISHERSRTLLRFPALVLLVIGLSAAQLFPFLDLLGQSQRDSGFRGSAWPMPPWGWANFLLPLFRMFPSYHEVHAQPGQYWISSYYVAIAVLLLAIVAIAVLKDGKVRLLGGLFLFAIWMALGNRGFLYKWLRASVAGLAMIRFPIKFVVLADFVLPLLGAFGYAHLTARPTQLRRRVIWIPAAILTASIAALIIFSELNPFRYSRAFLTTNNGLWRILFLLAGAGLLVNALATGVQHRLTAAFLCALVVADGLTHTTWENPVAPRWVYEGIAAQMQSRPALGLSRAMISPEAAEMVDHLKLDNAAEDVMASRISLYCNLNLLDHTPKVDGFYAVYPREMAQWQDLLYSTNQPSAGLMDFLGVTELTAPGTWQKWEHRGSALPLVTSPREAHATTNAVSALFDPSFNPRDEILVAPEDREFAGPHAQARIEQLRWTPEKIAFETHADSAALVIVAQSFYHRWTATIDRVPARILRANGAFQALAVPAGTHNVLLQYRDRAFQLGAILSFITLAIVATLLSRATTSRH